ncbi:MAG: acetyl-CoA C-acyltransferase, partial [Pseudomonadota bacterium]
MVKSVCILGASRTPIGGFQGELAGLEAPILGGHAIKGALEGPTPAIDEVLMGCVLPHGQGQAPARQAAFNAGLGEDIPATTLNKMCGSGMKTVMMAYDRLALGSAEAVVAGGMESMTNAPYLLPKMRGGARMGHGEVKDSMFVDGLEDAYDTGRLMGTFAEDCAESYQFTREAQDNFALASLSRATKAEGDGAFSAEIRAVEAPARKATVTVDSDEQPRNARPEKIPHLKPAFRKDGTVTAANSSSISDGAAALLLATEEAAGATGATVRARILGHSSH